MLMAPLMTHAGRCFLMSRSWAVSAAYSTLRITAPAGGAFGIAAWAGGVAVLILTDASPSIAPDSGGKCSLSE